jgi:hypothetical protein
MRKCISTSILVAMVYITCFSQEKYISASLWAIPLFQSGAGYGTLAFEYLPKNKNKSWQISVSMAGGSVAADIGATIRKWATIERIGYFGKDADNRKKFFYSFFAESGTRKILNGYQDFPDDSILQHKKSFELNPGMGIGKNFQMFRKMRLQVLIGPKIIFGFHHDKYYNGLNRSYFYDDYDKTRIGFRAMANFGFTCK